MENIDPSTLEKAMRLYKSQKARSLAYYHKNKEEINAKKMEQYYATNPIRSPVGRPPKNPAVAPQPTEPKKIGRPRKNPVVAPPTDPAVAPPS